jgi:hypothetical protein
MSESKNLYKTEDSLPVMVYRNLTRGCWSIKSKKTNRVIHHADVLHMRDCSFKVSQAGRERVVREQKKYVHAYVVGEFDSFQGVILLDSWKRVRYNPYINTSFVWNDDTPIEKAEEVFFDFDGKVYAR